VQVKDSQFDLSDPLVAAVDIPVVGPQAIGRYPTAAEARAAEVEFCKRIAERERQEREQRDRENARRTAAFAERVGARHAKVRRYFESSNYAATTRVDGFRYHRSEFATQRPREARRPLRRRSSAQRFRRQGNSRRGPPHLGSDDEECDPPGSLQHALARTSSTDRGAR
jgi:DNA-binding protein H-NS